jgi:Family of unknown function (DUF6174)
MKWFVVVLAVVGATMGGLASCGHKQGAAMWYSEPRSDYQMVVTEDCFCDGGTTHVRVRGTVVVRATQNGHPLALPTAMPLSVDDLFLLIYEGESQGWNMDITYDETWGYPTHIVGDSGGSDGEFEIRVDSFETYPPGQTP